MSTSYQVVCERVIRARSVYIYGLKPRRYRWVALLMAKLHSLVMDDGNMYLCTYDSAQRMFRDYRNWMGINRVVTE